MIKVLVPELLVESKMNATDLMRKGNIAYATALRLSKGQADGMTFEVLNSLCRLFQVNVERVLQYVPDEE